MNEIDLARWLRYVRVGDGCWEWIGPRNSGGYGSYLFLGQSRSHRKSASAHRIGYEHFVAELDHWTKQPLDHLCRNKVCVRPDHLEPVTVAENIVRGAKGVLRTHCLHGHPYEFGVHIRKVPGGERRPRRYCRECARIRTKEKNARYYPILKARRQAQAAARQEAS